MICVIVIIIIIIMYSSQLLLASQTARIAGAFLKARFYGEKVVNVATSFDVKLALDVEAQDLIAQKLLSVYPDYAFYGEEGVEGNSLSHFQWVVDPLDGTVNYFYGIPHFCVSIALRYKEKIVLGVIYDPMQDELWAVQQGAIPCLNGVPIHVSPRAEMGSAIICISPSSHGNSSDKSLREFAGIASQVRKIRMTGSAALALAYVAMGRYDAYVEEVLFLWDIAAGKLLVEAAGGKVELISLEGSDNQFSLRAYNGLIPLKEALA